MTKSSPVAAEGLVGVGATVHEVLALATHEDVETGTCVDGVVAGPALGHVVAGEVGDDVVALAAERDVGSVATLDDVVALAAPEGVVVCAAPDAVVDHAGLAVVHGLGVDARRHRGVGHAVADRAVGHPQQVLVLVALRGRVVLHRSGAGDELARAAHRGTWPRDVVELELAVGRRERVGLEGVRVGVAHDQLGERVALELGAQVHARRAGEVVEPVAVLQVGQLVLEHVVERAAQQATEQVRPLGQAAHPQVDRVDSGDGLAADVRPGAGAEHEVGGVGGRGMLSRSRHSRPGR